MYRVSELLGKPVISLSGDLIGTIGNIFFDEKLMRATCVKLYTEEDESVFLPMSGLISLENDAVVTKTFEGSIDSADGIQNPVNRPAFNLEGKTLGSVKDIVMEGAKIISFSVGDITLPSGSLISSKKVAVFNDTGRPVKVRSAKKPREKAVKREVEWPTKTVYAPSYDFLLGKKLQRNITTVDGKVIAREGQNVTDDIIKDAKKEGKLVVLALNSL